MKKDETILFLDASSPIVQVGILKGSNWLSFFKSEEQALTSIFQGVDNCLKMAAMVLNDVDHFAYCEGPGSLLGIRVSSMAIMGWKSLDIFKENKIYAYNSFELSVEMIQKLYGKGNAFYIVSGTRAGVWNILYSLDTKVIVEIEEENLKKIKEDKWYFKQKKLGLKDRDLELKEFDYNLEQCPEAFIGKVRLREVSHANALVVKEPEYVKWDFKRHFKEE